MKISKTGHIKLKKIDEIFFHRKFHPTSLLITQANYMGFCRQCVDAVGWAAGRASGL